MEALRQLTLWWTGNVAFDLIVGEYPPTPRKTSREKIWHSTAVSDSQGFSGKAHHKFINISKKLIREHFKKEKKDTLINVRIVKINQMTV